MSAPTVKPPSLTHLIGGMSPRRLRALYGEDPCRASRWVRAAAVDGFAPAQLCYGRMLLAGTGVARDERAALAWFRRAAVQGDPEAVNMLGRCLDEGWGTEADPSAAADCYRRAAATGHAWAAYNLGHLHLDGRGVARDPRRAFAWYRRAARQGHARAMNLLARCHEEGWGTPPDFAAAAHWFRRAADGGCFRGRYNWATILLRCGRIEAAVEQFAAAARDGSAGVRRAVRRLGTAPGAPDALAGLAARLQAEEGPDVPANPRGSH